MNAPFQTLHQMTFEDLTNVTSSPESVDGASPSVKPDGLTTDPSGRVVAPASLSARRAKDLGLTTSGTYGRTSSGSYRSASLSASLASRFQERTLTAGSILYRLTWKALATPSGRWIYALRALAHRTSGKGFTGVPTPMAGKTTPQQRDDFTPTLANVAIQFSGVPTPKLPSGGGTVERETPGGGMRKLEDAALQFTGVRTPAASDGEGGVMDVVMAEQNGYCPKIKLRDEAALFSGVATPTRKDDRQYSEQSIQKFMSEGQVGGHSMDLNAHSQMFGQVASGTSAETESTDPGKGKLNAHYSRWLMGYPASWCEAAKRASRSSKAKRRES